MKQLSEIVKNKTVAIFGAASSALITDISTADPKDFLHFSPKPSSGESVAFTSNKQVSRNNAKILLLRGRATAALRRYAFVGHAEQVLVPIGLGLLNPLFLWGMLRFATRGQYKYLGLALAPLAPLGQKYWLVLKPNKRKFNLGARVYYSPRLSIEDVVELLSPFDYCLLRWHEKLENWDASDGEDLDILISDDDAPRLIAALDERVGTQPIDLYSCSGGARTNFWDMAYMPPQIARQVLASATPATKGIKAPDTYNQFYSLVYHYLFHKGAACGLPSSCIDTQPNPTRISALERAAEAAAETAPSSMEDGAALLEKAGWLPPKDMLGKYAVKNPWVNAYFFSGKLHQHPPGLAAFFIRQIAADHDYIPTIIAELEQAGFKIVLEHPLTPTEQDRASRLIRGGNWGKGVDSIDGGLPVCIVVALDKNPQQPSPAVLKTHPLVDNQRVAIKHKLRDAFNARFEGKNRSNIMHASDNSDEALDYIEIVMPERLAHFQALLSESLGN